MAAELELALKELELAARRIEQQIEGIRRQAKLDEATFEQERARAAAECDIEDLRSQALATRSERDLTLFRTRRAIENDLSDGHVKTQLIARLPEIAQALPRPEELRTVNISSDGNGGITTGLVGFLASTLSLAEDALKRPRQTNGESK
jgi:hypothetical protein